MDIPETARIIIPDCVFHVSGWIDAFTCGLLENGLWGEVGEHLKPQLKYGRGRPHATRDHMMCRYADPGVTYTYKGKSKPAPAIPPIMNDLRNLVNRTLGTSFNTVVVNTYEPTASLYPHRDGKYIPELGDTPVIASVSLGATRSFMLHPVDQETGKRLKDGVITVKLAAGDLLVMHGNCDVLYQHSIPEEPDAVGTRTSLTFRTHRTV